MITYNIIGTIDEARARIIVFVDKKNRSIHLHIYCEKLSTGKRPIDVKQMNTKFPDDDMKVVIQHMLAEEMAGRKLLYEHITETNDTAVGKTAHPIRIIRRYR